MEQIREIQFIKSILDLLKEQYPNIVEKNVFSGDNNKLWDFFTAYKQNGIWKIICVDYWIFSDPDFLELKSHLETISVEENVEVVFEWSYIITQRLKRIQLLQDKIIFLGKLKHTLA